MVNKILSYAPAYPKLFRFCVGVLGVTQLLSGLYWMFASDSRSSSIGYTVIRQDMQWLSYDHPLKGWAVMFIIAGILTLYGVFEWKPPYAEVGLLFGAAIWAFFAAGLGLESLRSSSVSVFGPLIISPLIIFHLAFIVGLGNSWRR